MHQIKNVSQLSTLLLQTPNINIVSKSNLNLLWINSSNTLKLFQIKENDTKKTQFSYAANGLYFRAKILENWFYFSCLIH